MGNPCPRRSHHGEIQRVAVYLIWASSSKNAGSQLMRRPIAVVALASLPPSLPARGVGFAYPLVITRRQRPYKVRQNPPKSPTPVTPCCGWPYYPSQVMHVHEPHSSRDPGSRRTAVCPHVHTGDSRHRSLVLSLPVAVFSIA